LAGLHLTGKRSWCLAKLLRHTADWTPDITHPAINRMFTRQQLAWQRRKARVIQLKVKQTLGVSWQFFQVSTKIFEDICSWFFYWSDTLTLK